ncbi:sensor histidine kinase [Dysgonomonas sp. 216]|uniref:sensor histidine kinase n=1 Tax=Dysgonomonas sp. 216 TaxID=2302934 RepID=UPI0013D7DFE2|nr:ATP-binding protein [Dysgonomonas sp. 216]NDW18535.1 sensor histidine kinase [Dysgonomonas sp. 216]
MKITYKLKLFLGFIIIFGLFTVAIIILEQKEEKDYRVYAKEQQLDSYTEVIHSLLNQGGGVLSFSAERIDSLVKVLPSDLRISVISAEGQVFYDKDIDDISKLENHLSRPEIKKALHKKYGSNIRMSASTNKEYLYFAKFYSNYYIRVALPYDVEVKSALDPGRVFIYIALIMFVICAVLLNFIAGRFSSSINTLNNFVKSIKDGKSLPKVNFPHDELGDIGKQLVVIFNQKVENERRLKLEQEKLIQHFHFSKEGLCVFDKDHRKIYANTKFMQYLNLITDSLTFDASIVFTSEIFKPIQDFLSEIAKGESLENNNSVQVMQNGRTFDVQTVVFEDKSFEITIKDVTEAEKTSLLKHEMTSNIAHELRTPITSIRAYLETLNEQDLPVAKRQTFISRAYGQILRLSTLVEDVSLVSKMDEASTSFQKEKQNVPRLIDDARISLVDKLGKNNVKVNVIMDDKLEVEGNYTLLYAVFRNLIDNTLDHAGAGVDIYVNNYMQDSDYLYFSYYDTGKGVEEKHLNRLFERFYRADKGRTRETGGTGLGLSIVKNAILFHNGQIQVKNHKGGGLEFLFTLKK